MRLTVDEKRSLLRLARTVLEARLNEGRELRDPPPSLKLTDRLREPAGAFVTLEKGRELRGCIGYIEAIRPLYQSVMENALSACCRDYRFTPLHASELDEIEIEISVLTPKREIASYDEFIPGTHGIILEKNGRRAVFLPQVAAEHGWGREETLRHLAFKAGLPRDAWKEGSRLWVFQAELITEGETA